MLLSVVCFFIHIFLQNQAVALFIYLGKIQGREEGEMEKTKNYGHQHPLLLLSEEDQLTSNPSGDSAECSRCGDKVSAPCFVCAEDCGFYLHKVCADAPLELNHPLHQNHTLLLMQNPPSSYTWCVCDFCDETCEKFIYHCSCGLDFHIRCALFTFNIAENNLKELEHVALQSPLFSSEKDDEQLEDVAKCFGCWEPLANYPYFSLDCGFNLHKKCVELPLKLNHMCHRKHPLVLQFNSDRLACKICQETRRRGFIYVCSPCKFAIHIECVSPSLPTIIKDKIHEHPFTRILRRAPFICDACGTKGYYAAYVCSTCNIILHRRCISLPRIIRSKWHDHRIFHKYFLSDDFGSSDCIICHEEVSPELGNYCCSECNVTIHVNCVTEDKNTYSIVSLEDEDELANQSSITVLERNATGEATKIKHFKHDHNLMLSPSIGEHEKSCDGCMLPISDPFYNCSQCGFLLHKACAVLPRKKHVWHHECKQPLCLVSDKIVQCELCCHVSNTFAYKCCECEGEICLQCVIALTPGAQTCSKHEHPIFFYQNREGKCNACGDEISGAFGCKNCSFVLDLGCFSLPSTTRHKCDEHLLSLNDHVENDYSESHFCDICEEDRDPKLWFYRCAACDTSAHTDCVLGIYPFMKLGSIYEVTDHPHPLTFVQKLYYYPNCADCGKPCEDLSLECTTSRCNFIIDWDCAIDKI